MSTDSIRVLLVTSYFPPISGAGVFRWYYFAKFLSSKLELFVLTRKPESGEVTDPTLVYKDCAVKDVKRIPPFSISSIYKRFKKKGSDYDNRKNGSGRIVAFVQRWFQVPDQRLGEIPNLVKNIKHIVKEKRIDVIIATAPHYSYLVAAMLARRSFPNLKFIVDLRDPWSPAPLFPYPTDIHRRLNNFIEKQVLKEADRIIVVNDEMKYLYEQAFPEFARKFEVVYNGFVVEDYNKSSLDFEKNGWVVSFVGTLYAYRDPSLIIGGIDEFIKINKNFKGKVIFAGELKPPWDKKLPEMIRNKGLEQFIEVMGFIPRKRALGLMELSDALIHIVGDYPVGLSAKIFEYIYMGKPICVVGDKTGVVKRFLKKVEHPFQVCDNEVDFAKFLERLVIGELMNVKNEKIFDYSRKKMAEKLYTIIMEVVGEDSRSQS